MSDNELSFEFHNKKVPITFASPTVTFDAAQKAVKSDPFCQWVQRAASDDGNKNKKCLEIHSVHIQNVDFFGSRVGFVKIKADCTLKEGEKEYRDKLPGICFLRGNSVGILVSLFCVDDGKTYSLLVEQPRVPIGQASVLELPAGMIDPGCGTMKGVAVKEMKEECGIDIVESDLIDLTNLAANTGNGSTQAGICPSPGGSDEFIRLMYMEQNITKLELDTMKNRLGGLNEEGEIIVLKVVPYDDIWTLTSDAKALCALYLVEQLRKCNKLPPTPSSSSSSLATGPNTKKAKFEEEEEESNAYFTMNTGHRIPKLAFGMYKVAPTDCERVIFAAIEAGLRHFDTASFYDNEDAIGMALKKSGIPRKEFFITSKVSNDSQTKGREAVRRNFEQSLAALDPNGYLDLYLIHWPVPGHHTDTYKELQLLQREGKVRSIGLCNYNIEDYEELLRSGIDIEPAVNQFEISPAIYRRNVIEYFQSRGMIVCASKTSLQHGGGGVLPLATKEPIPTLAQTYGVSSAQIVLRWSMQKNLVVVAKTATPSRILELRTLMNFSLREDDIAALDDMDMMIEEKIVGKC